MHVLYVEDDPFDVDLTLRALARSAKDIRLENVATIAEARRILDGAGDSFDLAMIDLNLPDGSGVDLLAHIRGRGLPLAVVVVTGAGDEETAVALLKAGAEDYIVKNGNYLQHLGVILQSALQRFHSERARRARELTVIYADPSQEDIALARLHLSRFAPHIKIHAVSTAAELDSQLRRGTACDALILEYRLPDASALDLLKDLCQIRRVQFPILVVTGSGSEDVATQSLKLGAADYLIKNPGYVFRLPSAIENGVAQAALARDRAALLESEARFRRMAENAPDFIFRLQLKPETRFDYISPAAFKMVGYSAEEYYADPGLINNIVHPDDQALFERFKAGGVRSGEALLMRWLRKDGRQIWVELRISYAATQAGVVHGIEAIARDVTSQREAETEMQRQLHRLASLRSIDQAISNSFDLNLVMVVLIDKVISELKVDAASIMLFNPVNQMLEPASGSGFRTRMVDTAGARVGEAYAGLALYERRPILFPAPNLPPPSRDTARLMSEEDFNSGICSPLITKGEVKGVLQVFSHGLLKPDENWMGFLEALSSQAAIAIDNAELFHNLQRTNQDLKSAYDAMLEGWVRAMDGRYQNARGHTRSVTRLAMELAETLRITSDELADIRRGALLHDVGFLALPDAIILKPGPLTAEETEVMRQHPRLALEMLSPIPSLAKAVDIPYGHHERWDGSGYPRGAKGETIPYAARLFAVVDVWEAMTTIRPHRPPLSRQEARDYIRAQSGSHFDPEIAAAFLKMIS